MLWLTVKKLFIVVILILFNIFLLSHIKRYHPSITLSTTLSPTSSTTPPRTENKSISNNHTSKKVNGLLPVLVFGCNRPRALQNHIEALLKIQKNAELNPIIISLDCNHLETIEVARKFGDKVKTIIEVPDSVSLNFSLRTTGNYGYHRISRHYGYSLNHVLNVLDYEATIVTEDDLEVSPDFLDYFQALYPLLLYDKSIWCISAWNDNGIRGKIDRQPTLLHRSDFFPGLGWLLTKALWNEMKPKWPMAFWDDWMRKPEQRQNRVCIRPEISRTSMSPEGRRGVSGGQYYDGYLRKMLKNTDAVDWKSVNVTYLIKNLYDPVFHARIDACPVIPVSDLSRMNRNMTCAQLHYETINQFAPIAATLGLMNDIRSDTPRTSYLGVVQTQHGKTRIYITPKKRA